jgi:hypothetical protein
MPEPLRCGPACKAGHKKASIIQLINAWVGRTRGLAIPGQIESGWFETTLGHPFPIKTRPE